MIRVLISDGIPAEEMRRGAGEDLEGSTCDCWGGGADFRSSVVNFRALREAVCGAVLV